MAKIVGGFASSHSPLMSLTGELWAVHAQNDLRNSELVRPPDGELVSYEELLATADPGLAELANVNTQNSDQSDYQGWAAELRGHSMSMREEADKKKDADNKKLLQTFNRMKRTCIACHNVYQE